MSSPDPTSPASDSPTTAEARPGDAVLDEGTFTRVVEARSENRLRVGDGAWHQVSPRYVTVQLIANGVVLALIVTLSVDVWQETVVPLAQSWPQDVYSLSHVAVPFPPDDDLYGREPRVKNRYGISLGTIALWGETSVLSVGKEALMRVTSNPFYDYLQERINSRIGDQKK